MLESCTRPVCDNCRRLPADFQLPLDLRSGERLLRVTCAPCYLRLTGARPNQHANIQQQQQR